MFIHILYRCSYTYYTGVHTHTIQGFIHILYRGSYTYYTGVHTHTIQGFIHILYRCSYTSTQVFIHQYTASHCITLWKFRYYAGSITHTHSLSLWLCVCIYIYITFTDYSSVVVVCQAAETEGTDSRVGAVEEVLF